MYSSRMAQQMEQIDVEDELNNRIRELEEQLGITPDGGDESTD